MTTMLRRAMSTLFVSIVVLAVGWGVVGAEQVTIHVWDTIPANHRDVFLTIIDEFQAQNPHITVKVEKPAGGYVGVLEKTTVALAGGAPPNIVHLAHAHSYVLRKLGVFMPLNDYMANDPMFNMDDWYPPAIEAASMDGTFYGVPFNISVVSFYYSPYRLEDSGLDPVAPSNWEEVRLFGQRVAKDTSGDGIPDIWAMDITDAGGFYMEAWLGQAGAYYVNQERTEMIVNSPAGIRTYEFLQELIHDYQIAHYPSLPAAKLISGDVGWFIRSSAEARNWLQTSANDGVPLSLAPLPCEVQCYVPIGGGALYAIDTGTQAERDATYQLLSFLTQPDNVARYAAASGYLATRKSALESPYLHDAFTEFPSFLVNYESLQYAHPETSVPEFARIQGLFGQAVPILRDKMPAKPILDEIVRQGNAILNDFYARLGDN